MPYARLLVPIAPGLALAFVDLAEVAHRAATWGRALVASGLGVALLSGAAPAGRRVYADRNALVVRARPLLDLPGTRVVAALDIGWVGAATGAELVDLAGLTDPAIASLRGGHTSKRLLGSPLFAERFERAAELPLGDRGASYAVYRRRPR